MQQLERTVTAKVNLIHIADWNYFFFVLKNFRLFIPYSWLRNKMAEQEQRFFALNWALQNKFSIKENMLRESSQFFHSPTDAQVNCLKKQY
jgi:hypothetical protein